MLNSRRFLHRELHARKIQNGTNSQSNTNSDEPTYKCKTCPKSFRTLQLCLSHELEHLAIHEGPSNPSVSGNERKKRKRKNKSKYIRLPEFDAFQEETNEQVIQALEKATNGREIAILTELYQPNPEDLNRITYQIYSDLMEILHKQGKWEISIFGSTVTGMAFKGSDIDIYLERLKSNRNNKRKMMNSTDIKNDSSSSLPNIFRQIANILYRSNKFSKVIPIHSALVPVIKCTHISSSYSIDISCASKVGVFNSNFLAKLMKLDNRVPELMMIIKIWAKNWQLTKIGRITNYCLVLFVVFFLQTRKPQILPGLKFLQQHVSPVNFKGMNFAFNDNIRWRTENQENLKELISGFFEFFYKFNFADWILCPYLGMPINRQQFIRKEFEFVEYESQLQILNEIDTTEMEPGMRITPLKTDSVIVVQDPFYLNLNKTHMVNEQLLIYFKGLLEYARMICSQASSDELIGRTLSRIFFEKPNLNNEQIERMLKFSEGDSDNDKMTGETSSTVESNANPPPPLSPVITHAPQFKTMCKFSPIECELTYIRIYLRKTFPDRIFSKFDINRVWAENIIEFIKEILLNYFKMDVVLTQNVSQNKRFFKAQKKSNQTDVHNVNENEINERIGIEEDNKRLQHVEYILKSDRDLWTGRKNESRKSYQAFLEDQLEITKNLEETRMNSAMFTVNLSCRLTLVFDEDFSNLTLTFEDLVPRKQSGLQKFFTEFTQRMRPFYRAFFERLAVS